MPSQDDYLDKLLKKVSGDENEDLKDEGNEAEGQFGLDAVTEMTEEEIEKLLAAGIHQRQR